MKIKRTILGLICTVVLASCVFQVPEPSQQGVIPRTGDVSARVPFPPTLEPQFIDLKEAGFSLVLQDGFEFEIDDSSINLSDPLGGLIISLNGRPYIASSYTLESFLEKYISEMASRGGTFEQGDPYEISIDGIDGLAIDVHGTFLDLPMAGKAVVISPGKDFIVFGLGMSNLSTHKNGWNESGSHDFEAILGSMKFKDEIKK